MFVYGPSTLRVACTCVNLFFSFFKIYNKEFEYSYWLIEKFGFDLWLSNKIIIYRRFEIVLLK